MLIAKAEIIWYNKYIACGGNCKLAKNSPARKSDETTGEIGMKKTYVKPEIAFDDFTLSNTIAASCENYNNLPSLGQCGYNAFGANVFYSAGMSGCEDWEFVKIKGILYEFGVAWNGLFNSL